MSKKQIEKQKHDAENSRTAWLLTLDLARERGDARAVETAVKKLRELGVEVKYRDEERHE